MSDFASPKVRRVFDTQADAPSMYQAVRAELIRELRRLNAASASLKVPACPEWTVKDVVAHLCGLNVELLAGVPFQSIGSEEATGRQVADRERLSLGEVVDEWLSASQSIDELFVADTNAAAALLADLVVHAYDLHELLAQDTTVAATAIPLSAHRYANRLQHRVADEMRIALAVEFTNGETFSAPEVDGGSSVTLRTSTSLFARGVTGRLRRAEVEAFDWSDDPSGILDRAWNLYGPFRT